MDTAGYAQTRWQTSAARLARGHGSTNIIALNAIRQQAGDRWERMRESLASRLEALLRQRLGPADFFVPIDPATYLVVMPSTPPEEGQICCLRISYELHKSFLGVCGVEHLDIAHATCVSDDVLEMTPLTRFEIVQLADRADLELASPGEGELSAAGLSPNTAPVAPSMPANVEIVFLPQWDVEHQVIRAYRCLPRRKAGMAPLPSAQADAKDLAQMTLASLHRVAEVLDSHLAHNERFMINLPISYAALSAPLARMEFTAACRQLDCDLRPYLVFKLEELPVGVPHSRLVELVTTLKPFCRAVFAKAPRREPVLELYRGLGFKALGIGVKKATFEEAKLAVARLASESRRTGICAFVDDVPDIATFNLALDSGIKWISGEAIIPAVSEPGPLVHLSLDTLLSQAAA